MATTDRGHSAWGPRHIHRLTPLPRTQISETAMRAPPLPNCHRDHHCTLQDSSNLPAPWILCTLEATHTKHTPHSTSSQPPPPVAQTVGLQLWRLQEGHDAEAPPSHIQLDKVFTPKSPMRNRSSSPAQATGGGGGQPKPLPPSLRRHPPSCRCPRAPLDVCEGPMKAAARLFSLHAESAEGATVRILVGLAGGGRPRIRLPPTGSGG
jgi:hypothetical protein